MDYRCLAAASQPHSQFLGLPPTPAHTGSANSDDFSNSPPVWPQSQSFLLPKQDVFELQHFEASTQHCPIRVNPQPSISNSNHNYAMSDGDQNNASDRRGRNSANNDNMTPGSRRKAQNRAVQQAFRKRQEQNRKALEAKVAACQKDYDSVIKENKLLKSQLQRKTTENEALKAIKAHPHWGGPQPLPDAWAMSCPPRDFYTKVLHTHENKTLSHRFVASNARERLLALTAMWDCINMHPLYIRGRVNIEDVSERLKKVAKWDRQGGPVFEEREIINAIERSITSGSDELLS